MRKNSLVLFFFLVSFVVIGQDNSPFVCPVTDVDGKLLLNPFVGGFDSPQFNQMDFDGDGDKDVVVFDRPGNVSSVFLFTDGEYLYDHDLNVFFSNFKSWVRFYDYNQDGVTDVFASSVSQGVPGVEVWTGKRNGDTVSFELFDIDNPNGDYLVHLFNLNFTNVYVSPGDLPSFDDVDGDGDVDMLAFEPDGSYVTFYKNYALEENLGLDTFVMKLENVCFGRFYENSFSQAITLSSDQDVCAVGLQGELEADSRNLHAGSTVTAIDMDNDNDMDLFIGDLSSSNMVYLENGGTVQNAWMTDIDETFPSTNFVINMPIFLGSFLIDVDQDGNDDLVVAPNQDNVNANLDNAWYYRNEATDGSYDFSFRQKDFLVGDMLDFGTFSSPDFVDVNQDGLLDLIVGSDGEFQLGGTTALRLTYLRNIGTKENPVFEVADEDWLGFSQFKDFSEKPSPSFGDLDSDGDIDLIVGDANGFLYYFENIAGPDVPLEFANPIYQYQDIKVGSNVRADLVDLNEDGLTDLVIGEKANNGVAGNTGSLNYFQNLGSVGNPIFESNITVAPNTPTLGGVDVQELNTGKPASSPRFIKTEDDFLLVVGNVLGRLWLYNDILGNVQGDFNLLDTDFMAMRQGERSVPAMADIDNDGYLELVLGNFRGGLSFFNTTLFSGPMTSTENILPTNSVTVYPNPVSERLLISTALEIQQAKIFDISGKHVQDIDSLKTEINIAGLSNGLYILHLFTEEGVLSKKFIVQ